MTRVFALLACLLAAYLLVRSLTWLVHSMVSLGVVIALCASLVIAAGSWISDRKKARK